MKKTLLLTCLFLHCLCSTTWGQGEQNVWAFGDKAGLDFNTTTPSPVTNNLAPCFEGCASICNAAGQLLFYTNGWWVWNRYHEIMPELTGGVTGIINPIYPTAYPPMIPFLGGAATQPAAITNVPAQPGRYYIFSLTTTGQLYYTMIDMSMNAGKGGIVTGKKSIGIATDLYEKLTVINGCNNIWIMTRSKIANEYRAFEVNDTGIVTTPVISNVGLLPLTWYRCGVIKFSADGTKMAAATNNPDTRSGGLELYNFDALTGKLSNAKLLDSSTTKGYYYGACFSPDNTKLYASTSSFAYNSVFYYGKVRQFNLSLLTLPAIVASNTIVYTDNVYLPDNIGDLKRGKDNKIYFGSGKANAATMHRIALPNSAGLACAITPNAIIMPYGLRSERGLPNDVAVLPAPDTVGTKHNISVCFRDSVALTADTGKRYNWSNVSTGRRITVTQTGSYVVRYINTTCQYVKDTYAVHFYRLPSVTSSGYSCAGKKQGTAWIKPKSGDTSTFLYTWKDAGGNLLRQRWSNKGDTLKGLDSGSYFVQITTASGCDTTLRTTILSVPTPVVAMVADSAGCVDAPLFFTGTTDAPIWKWQFGDYTSSSELNPQHSYAQTGSYTARFIATNIEGCSDTATKTITIRGLDMRLAADKKLVNMGEWVHLQSAASEPYTVIAWEPAHLFPDQTAIRQTVVMDTTQTFVVTGRSAYGCIAKASVLVEVTPKVFMPNAFSPNNDGVNDRFRPVSTGYIFVRNFEVYNRFGQKVYWGYGTKALEGWDGAFGGQLQDIGTFFYQIDIETKEGSTIALKGDVILIR